MRISNGAIPEPTKGPISFETFMSYWMGPGQVIFRGAQGKGDEFMNGMIIYMMTMPESYVLTYDIRQLMKDDHPHLADLLDQMETLNFHKIIFTKDSVLRLTESAEITDWFFEQTKENETLQDLEDTEDFLWAEFMQGRPKEGADIAHRTGLGLDDEMAHRAIMNAFDWTIQEHGLSTLMKGGGMITSIAGNSKPGGEPVVTQVMGEKIIDQTVDAFRAEMDAFFADRSEGGDDNGTHP